MIPSAYASVQPWTVVVMLSRGYLMYAMLAGPAVAGIGRFPLGTCEAEFELIERDLRGRGEGEDARVR